LINSLINVNEKAKAELAITYLPFIAKSFVDDLSSATREL